MVKIPWSKAQWTRLGKREAVAGIIRSKVAFANDVCCIRLHRGRIDKFLTCHRAGFVIVVEDYVAKSLVTPLSIDLV